MTNDKLEYCFFQEGICLKCGFKVNDFNPNIPTRRFCDSSKVKYHLKDMDLLYDRNGQSVSLKGIYTGASIVYVGSGPSLTQLDLSLLKERHVTTFAVNNVAANLVKPNIWMCSDNPQSFHPVIWRDPTILKIVAAANARKYIREVDGDGKTKTISDSWAIECPNTLCVNVVSKFNSSTFFDEPTACWGCEKGEKDDIGLSGGRSTMLAAFKVLTWLGFKRIYLIGCDFNMQHGNAYAFEQDKARPGCKTNNEMFIGLEKRLKSLQSGFNKYGVKIVNCTPGGNLNIFSRMEFKKAIDLIKYPHKSVETKGWYL